MHKQAVVVSAAGVWEFGRRKRTKNCRARETALSPCGKRCSNNCERPYKNFSSRYLARACSTRYVSK